MRRLPVLALALFASACARNAVLEVELTVPGQLVGPARFAVVQFETGEQPFGGDWRSSSDYPGVELASEPQTLAYSVISEDPETVVLVKVSFCTTEDCSAIDDAPDRVPAVWFRLERAFYIGQRTRWERTIDAIPAEAPMDDPGDVVEVGKCEIEGCITAGAETQFCRLSGEHYCE